MSLSSKGFLFKTDIILWVNFCELCVLQLRFCSNSLVERTLQQRTMIYIWLISGWFYWIIPNTLFKNEETFTNI